MATETTLKHPGRPVGLWSPGRPLVARLAILDLGRPVGRSGPWSPGWPPPSSLVARLALQGLGRPVGHFGPWSPGRPSEGLVAPLAILVARMAFHHGHEHGWDTLATQCGRSTSSHAPIEHRTRPTTAWDGYCAVETMHSTAQPRQHASDRTHEAQRRHRPTTPTSTSKRRPHRHTKACCNGLRGAAARRACRASAPSRSDLKSPPSRTLQAGEPTAELPAPRRETH